MSTYLNPTIIELDDVDFTKIDVVAGWATFKEADFAIADFGTLSGLSITVDRVYQKITFLCSGADTDSSGLDKALLTSDYSGDYLSTLTEDKANYHYNYNCDGSGEGVNSANLLCGTVFNMVVRAIFSSDTYDFSASDGLDFTKPEIRQTNIFFYNESEPATESLVLDVETKTQATFNRGEIDGSGEGSGPTWSDEMEYWGYRTSETYDGSGQEETSVPFTLGDKMWVMYQLSINFTAPDGSTNPTTYDYEELDALEPTAPAELVEGGATTLFTAASFDMLFVLEWSVVPL